MKNYRSRVTPAMLRECATEPCAANAEEKAIAWLSRVSRFRCIALINSVSNGRTQDNSVGTSAELTDRIWTTGYEKGRPEGRPVSVVCGNVTLLNHAPHL